MIGHGITGTHGRKSAGASPFLRIPFVPWFTSARIQNANQTEATETRAAVLTMRTVDRSPHTGLRASLDRWAEQRTPCRPLREIVFRFYRIFYDASEEARRVEILHVWHGAREDPKL